VGTFAERLVEHPGDVGRIVLPVLVHGHDPAVARRGHAGDSGGVLSEVPGQPNTAHLRDSFFKLADHPRGIVRPVVVDEQDLVD